MLRLLLLAVLLAVGALAGGLGAAFIAPPAPGGPPLAASAAQDPSGAGGTGAGPLTATAAIAPVGVPASAPGSAPGHGTADAGALAGSHAPRLDERSETNGARSFIAVGRQLIIPIVRGQSTRALILFELAIDVPAEMTEATHAVLPRLRDAFLRELFAMSYTGAFDQTYTDARVIDEMRRNLRSAAREILGDEVAEVLVLDVMRQEL